jgi:hypothetical protein
MVYYAARSGNFSLTFRYNLSVPTSVVNNPKALGSLNPEDGTDRLYRNVGEKLPLLAA